MACSMIWDMLRCLDESNSRSLEIISLMALSDSPDGLDDDDDDEDDDDDDDDDHDTFNNNAAEAAAASCSAK